MSKFMIRVELLHSKTLEDDAYRVLHRKMEAKKYWRKIKFGNTGDWLDLPPAEYQCFSADDVDLEISAIRDEVVRIASEIDKDNRVVVTKGIRAIHNLRKSTWQGGPQWEKPMAVSQLR